MTEIPKPIPAERIKKQRELEQKQRYLERKIRKYKRFQVGSCDPETAKAYGRKVREAQAELRELIKANEPLIKRDYEREKVYDGEVDKNENSGIIKANQAKAIDIFNDNDLKSDDITSEEIIEELSKSNIGKETIRIISELPENIILTHGTETGLRGEERFGQIKIYVNQCKNVQWVARTIIHEVTHYQYGIGESQWAECVCIAQELKHARNRNYLTVAEKRMIVKAVKSDEDYNKLNWRKGGLINGRRKNHR